MKPALIIIDVQNDYFKNGKMELSYPEKVLENINKLEGKFASLNFPIIYIKPINYNKNALFFYDTSGVNFHKGLLISKDSMIIEKHFPNSFKDMLLLNTLSVLKVNQGVITGMMTHMCVDSTTRAASELGYKPILISEKSFHFCVFLDRL